MLYKVTTQPSVEARRPRIAANATVHDVAAALGRGSSVRALYSWAKDHPTPFWTKLYAKCVETGPQVQVQVNTTVVQQTLTFGDKTVEF